MVETRKTDLVRRVLKALAEVEFAAVVAADRERLAGDKMVEAVAARVEWGDRTELPPATFAGLAFPYASISVERVVPYDADRNVDLEPIEPTNESIGLVLVEPPISAAPRMRAFRANIGPGCYRMATPLHPSAVTGEARVLVVEGWDDYRAAPLDPGNLPATAGIVLGEFVGSVRVSRQYVAVVCLAWGRAVVWSVVEHGAVKYVAAWKLRRGAKAVPVAALAPLGERHGTVDPSKAEA